MANNVKASAKDVLRPTHWPKRAMWLSLLAGFLGVVLGYVFCDPRFAVRGGSIGVAMSFAILFFGRATSEIALTTEISGLGEILPTIDADAKIQTNSQSDLLARIEALEDKEQQLRGSLSSLLDWSNLEKRFLIISSVFSTLMTGFGDLIVLQLIRI